MGNNLVALMPITFLQCVIISVLGTSRALPGETPKPHSVTRQTIEADFILIDSRIEATRATARPRLTQPICMAAWRLSLVDLEQEGVGIMDELYWHAVLCIFFLTPSTLINLLVQVTRHTAQHTPPRMEKTGSPNYSQARAAVAEATYV
jgi:hypothetical protein